MICGTPKSFSVPTDIFGMTTTTDRIFIKFTIFSREKTLYKVSLWGRNKRDVCLSLIRQRLQTDARGGEGGIDLAFLFNALLTFLESKFLQRAWGYTQC